MAYAMSDFQEKYENMDGDASEWVDGDDGEWEDEEDVRRDERYPRTSSRAGSNDTRPSPRKRRRPTFQANGSRRQVPTLATNGAPKIPHPKADEPPLVVREEVIDGVLHGAVFTIRYAIDVFSRAIHFLRYPLSALLGVWLFGFIIMRLSPTLRSAFAPLCIIPGISSSSICRWDPQTPAGQRTVQWADYPHLVETQSKTFEQLMEKSVGNSALSLEIKKTEVATRDLVTLVQISNLKAKNSLATSLIEFLDDAKKTGRRLHKLTSKVGGAVDRYVRQICSFNTCLIMSSIMAVNDYALRSIESARKNEPSAWSLSSLAVWRPPPKRTDDIVRETFEEAMNTLSTNMERLILEAEANLQNLDDLEARLESLHELVSREDLSMSSAKSELLAELWTKLGGNRKQLRNFESHLALLNDLGSYRKQALAHVVGALQTLRAMSEDMEDMRERVAAPELMGSSVPVEVHMKSIEMGLERLREGRLRAKRLDDEAMRRVMMLNGSDDD